MELPLKGTAAAGGAVWRSAASRCVRRQLLLFLTGCWWAAAPLAVGAANEASPSIAGRPAPSGEAKPDPKRCELPSDLAPAPEPLPVLARALKEGPPPVTVVVLGSLSAGAKPEGQGTVGFPARLRNRLQAELADRAVAVPLRVEMVGRTRAAAGELGSLIKRQVLPLKPALVIWQVGRADARQGNTPHRFGQSLKEGLEILQQAGIDTILADIQFHPQFEALYRTDDYRHYVRWVAGKRDLPLLRRYEMIEYWAASALIDLDSGDDAVQQTAFEFIQECIAFHAARMIVGGSGVASR
jgi:acyl-CoA thioesterase-1